MNGYPLRLAIAVAALVTAGVLLGMDVEPVPTWFYVFAWYPVLFIADTVAHRRGFPSLFASPPRLASVLGWSIVIWLLYEAVNLRIANWYYVFLPVSGGWRWTGILVSFATVMPAVLLAERLLDAFGVGHGWKRRPLDLRERDLAIVVATGMAMLVLSLAWPRFLSLLVWGAGVLIADPILYRSDRRYSLIGDFVDGRWDRGARLLLGGAVIGLLWEGLNYWARGKWIYTVPFLESVKWFEMPPLGFVGFPVFALSAWSLYHLLCAWGVALPLGHAGNMARNRLRIAVPLAAVVSVTILAGMERRTNGSVTPMLEALPGMTPATATAFRAAGLNTPFAIARVDVAAAAGRVGLPDSMVRSIYETASLATMRGLGAQNAGRLGAIGIETVCELARLEPRILWAELRGRFPDLGYRPNAAELRVWTRAAASRCGN